MATLPRDPLDELIADLERALPTDTQPGQYAVLPTLEDLQAVIGAILFSSEEKQRALDADPQHQQLHEKVLRQLSEVGSKRG